MCAELADRHDRNAGDTVRLSALPANAELTSIARYRILSELGQGAMARVYLALDPNINRKVALKVLAPRGLVSAIDQDELRTRFLLEARAAGNLRHPAAVAIYDADHDPDTGLSFIAMEWVDGQSLDELLKQETVLSTDQAVDIVCQMAGALDAAHRQGLIHRDVKPANILLSRLGDAKLSDFGIAKAESLELTSTGQILGTPFYMSPEQIRDEDLDGRSDLFSLGVVLYQSLTGRQPFHAESLPALTHKILNVEPVEPATLNPEIPSALASTMTKALAKDPDERFQTGAELVATLQGDAPAQATTIAPTASPTVSLTQPSQYAQPIAPQSDEARTSRPWRNVLGVMLFLAALAVALAAIWKSDSAPPPPPEISAAASAPEASPAIVHPDATSGADRAQSEARATAEPRPIGDSTLQISYTNRLKSATMAVWIDGVPVLTKSLYGPRGVIKRAVGRTYLESIPVSAGHHDIKVSIRGTAGKIEASNRTGSTFDAGQTRRLRVELIPPSYLKLAWK